MSVKRLVDFVLWYGTPSLFLFSCLLIALFLYLGKVYRTPEEERLHEERDDGIMVAAMWCLVLSELLGLVLLFRGC